MITDVLLLPLLFLPLSISILLLDGTEVIFFTALSKQLSNDNMVDGVRFLFSTTTLLFKPHVFIFSNLQLIGRWMM